MPIIDAASIEPETVSYSEAYVRLEAALDGAEEVTNYATNSQRATALAVERAIHKEMRKLLDTQLASSSDNYAPLTDGIKSAVEPLKDAAERIDKLVGDFEKAAKLANAAARVVAILT